MTAHDGLGSVRADARKNTTEAHWDPATARLIDTAVAERDAWWRGQIETLAPAVLCAHEHPAEFTAMWDELMDELGQWRRGELSAPQPETTPERDGSFFAGGHEVTRADYLALTGALEYGDDGFQSPAAHPRELIDPLTEAMDVAREHDAACPEWCDECDHWERPRSCEPCHGSGCGPRTALGAYAECQHCAGDGRDHQPYTPTGTWQYLPMFQPVPAPSDTPSIEDVLMQHQRIPLFDGTGGQRCVACDHLHGETDGPNSPRHVAHVARVLRESGAK